MRPYVETFNWETIGLRLTVTISLGFAQRQLTDGVASLLVRADRALYRAKNSGRNRVEFR